MGEGASQSSASSPACGRSVGLRGGRASRLHGGGFSRGAPLCATRPLLGASVEVSNLWHRGPFLSARCRSCGWLAGCVRCVAPLRCLTVPVFCVCCFSYIWSSGLRRRSQAEGRGFESPSLEVRGSSLETFEAQLFCARRPNIFVVARSASRQCQCRASIVPGELHL